MTLEGQYLFQSGAVYYSPPFPRPALDALFSIEVKVVYGTVSMTFTLQSRKNAATSWIDVDSATITGVGVTTIVATDLEEQWVRTVSVDPVRTVSGPYGVG